VSGMEVQVQEAKNINRQSRLPAKRTSNDENETDSMKTTLAKDKDMTPCDTCFIRHCDSSNQSWIQCQQCEASYHRHNAC